MSSAAFSRGASLKIAIQEIQSGQYAIEARKVGRISVRPQLLLSNHLRRI